MQTTSKDSLDPEIQDRSIGFALDCSAYHSPFHTKAPPAHWKSMLGGMMFILWGRDQMEGIPFSASTVGRSKAIPSQSKLGSRSYDLRFPGMV